MASLSAVLKSEAYNSQTLQTANSAMVKYGEGLYNFNIINRPKVVRAAHVDMSFSVKL